MLPTGTAACGQLAQKARLRFGLCSATSRTAPPHSPPTAKPCRNRNTTSNTGAQIADLAVRRQAAHQERDGTDQQQAELQQLLAPVLVAEVPEDDAAERTRQESDAVGQERREDGAVSLSPCAKNTLLKTSVARCRRGRTRTTRRPCRPSTRPPLA